jgi:hypothetical protein
VEEEVNQESNHPFVNFLIGLMAFGGFGSWIVSHMSQIEQGWRVFNLLLGSVATIVWIYCKLRKKKD